MSAENNHPPGAVPPTLLIKLLAVIPPASKTVKSSGPGLGLLPPSPHTMHSIELLNTPNGVFVVTDRPQKPRSAERHYTRQKPSSAREIEDESGWGPPSDETAHHRSAGWGVER